MADIRHMHACRFETINPVSDMIDRMAGEQWYATPNFWNGGVSEPYTVDCEPLRALFQFVMYGELFKSSLQAWLDPDAQLPKYSLEARLDFVRHCIPEGQGAPRQDSSPHVDAVSYPDYCGDGVALHHVLSCGRWNRSWETIRHQIGPDFDGEESWRQEIWVQAAQLHGLAGLELLRPGGVDKWKERLENTRSNVARMPSKSPIQEFGRRDATASECPNLVDELNVHITLTGYW